MSTQLVVVTRTTKQYILLFPLEATNYFSHSDPYKTDTCTIVKIKKLLKKNIIAVLYNLTCTNTQIYTMIRLCRHNVLKIGTINAAKHTSLSDRNQTCPFWLSQAYNSSFYLTMSPRIILNADLLEGIYWHRQNSGS